MRNIFKYSAVAFAALIAAACQHELSELSVAGEETIVKFTVNAPAGMQTKADEVPESKVNRLYVEVYTDEACTELYSSEVVEGEQTGWNLEMSVLKGHTYHMLLVAGCYGYFVPNETESRFNNGIKMKYSAQEGSEENGNGNMEEHDLFVAKTSFTSETAGGTITLTRPLAQINIYANDLKNQALEGKITLKKQSVTISNIADVHYPVTGTSSENGNEATFMTTDSYTEDGRVLMCYVLPVNDGNQRLVDISLALDFDYDGLTGQHLDYDIPNVPIQKNHRTNIYGNLYCEQAEFTFTLDSFEDDVVDVELWDGTSSVEPPLVDSDEDGDYDTYLLSSAEHLAWIRDLVNGNLSQTRAEAGNSLADFTIKLEQDIDLSGKEWEPIGNYASGFCGTFDGQGHTIRNFKVTETDPSDLYTYAGLFGYLGDAYACEDVTIKNLTVDNAHILCPADYDKDFYAAALAAYSSWGTHLTISSVKVTNSVVQGVNKVGGLLGHDDQYYSILVDDCHVENCTIETLSTNDGGAVGGLIGYFDGTDKVDGNTAEHVIKNSSVSNCKINAINCTDEGKRSNSEFIGCVKLEADQIIRIENCKIENNEFSQITGSGSEVTYVSPFGAMVGGERSESVHGKIIIDGLEIIANGIGLNADGEYVITSVDGFKNFRDKVNKNSDSFAADGKKFILAADIDLQNEEFIPIGIGGGPYFCGSFDGQDHTIRNYQITKEYFGKSQGALFASIAGTGTIENLTIDNATIKYPTEFSETNKDNDFYASALAGSIYGTRTFKNITIKNSYIEGKNKVGALIAHDAVCYITVENCHAINCTLESNHTEDGGNVGGLIGYLQSWTDKISNSSVTGCTINTYNPNNESKRSNGEFIGCVQGGNDDDEYIITNCKVSGNTFTQKLSDGTPLSYNSPYGQLVGGNRYDKGLVMIDGTTVPEL